MPRRKKLEELDLEALIVDVVEAAAKAYLKVLKEQLENPKPLPKPKEKDKLKAVEAHPDSQGVWTP